ncbi:MAG: hypothetical protein K2O24_00815 [Muribaculaceae bacterium]|nr:hypothetical protein [Muribaculaceae bacterium]
MTRGNGSADELLRARRAFVAAYNKTQVTIWKDRVRRLGAVDTGRLLRSVRPLSMIMDSEVLDFTLSQEFTAYGVWVNFGVGRGMKAGQRLHEGVTTGRRAKRWFDRSHFRSVANLRDFMAENIGHQTLALISNALSDESLKRLARGGAHP